MTRTVASTPPIRELQLGIARETLEAAGPCISILLTPYRPGDPSGSPAAIVKSTVQDAGRQLAARGRSQSDTEELLAPLRRLEEDPSFASGANWGRAIFRSPGVFEQFRLVQSVQSSLTIAGSFVIRPIAAELMRPPAFYVLGLSKTAVRLLRCSGLDAELAPLPPGVPATLAEALEMERPDHLLENRSSAGGTSGAMRRVRFGMGSDREKEHAHLADFYKIVDRGLQKLLHKPGIPLILSGVDEDTAAYRAGSGYGSLMRTGISGSLDAERDQPEILERAYSILWADARERRAAELRAAKERASPARFSTEPDKTLRLAFEGRIAQLYVNESESSIGVFERDRYRSWGKEDLLNLAMVQTLVHGGEAHTLPAAMIPEQSAIVGIMRY